MDIHRPKAAHSIREFLIEIGTIICGILIALGLEQVVETLHRRELVARAEDSLRDNFLRFVRFTGQLEVENGCMASRVGELRRVLDASAVSGRLPTIGVVPQPSPRPWQIDTWEAMIASQIAPYIPRERVVLYSRVAMSAADLYVDGTAEWGEWGALRSLTGAARPISEAEQAKVRDTLARAAAQADLVQLIARNTVSRIGSTGLLTHREVDAELEQGRAEQREHPEMCKPIEVSGG